MGIREQFRDKAERLAAEGKQRMHEVHDKASGHSPRPADRDGERQPERPVRPEQREEHSRRGVDRER